MHQSRLSTVIIDCEDLDRGAAFWCGALGTNVRGQDETYAALEPVIPGLQIAVQRVSEGKSSKSRVHLDIMSDDIEAEARRLQELGAKRRELVEGWWVMEDPFGNEFCVVPVGPRGFGGPTKTWLQ